MCCFSGTPLFRRVSGAGAARAPAPGSGFQRPPGAALWSQRIPREERGRSLRFTVRFGFALGEIYGPDRKFGLWGRSGGWHILQGRKDSRWAAVQNAAYGHLRDALIMGVGHMQASVAAAARRMWVATLDSTATSRASTGTVRRWRLRDGRVGVD